MTAWQDLIETALLGTERRPFKVTPQGSPLDDILSRLDSSNDERAPRSVVAAMSIYQRVGRLPVTDSQPVPAPCALDDAPRCSPRAGQHLALLLDGQHAQVLSEWLAALGLTQKRVPEESLPALLDLGKAQPDVREAILPVLGERGLWLAAQSPDWDYALGGDDAAAWQTGSLPIRLMLLQKLRRSDTTRARELMASTWPTDAPDERTAFLAACAINLGTDDEPFLEAALDDRRKEVRRMAADLLAQLPESRLCGRMLDRLRPLLTLTRGLKPNIEVTLPAECDKGMLRDGVEPKPPSGMGEKAWWLQQILGAVPPSIWSQTWRTSPKDLVQAAGRGEWRMMLLQGWAVAAMRQRDTEWIEALLADFLAHNELAQAQPAFEGLDDSRKEAFVLSLLHSNPSLQPMQLAYHFLLRCRHPWSVALSRAVLDSLQRHTSNGDIGPQFGWSPFLLEVARYMNPELIAEAESRLHEAAVSGIDAIDNFLNLLRFRYDMLKEIQP